ncbi:MAG: efflux RND transporter periplasmic adaptor subunit [Clostridiales bacterium]|nr:efflux RND transporter periplasmic adaptor subunit [Clostridiales bacterium]
MKRTDNLTNLVSLLLFGALLAYLGVYFLHSVTNNIRTAPAVYVSISENALASGIIVRQETLMRSSEKYLSVIAENGRLVSKGEPIAVLYSNEDALKRASEIKDLELKKQYISSVLAGINSAEDLSDRDNAIKKAVTSLTASAVRREMDSLASAAISLSSLVIEKSDVGATKADLDAINAKIQTLKQNALKDTVAITAQSAGLFSSSPAGYEHIPPDMLSSLDPESLRKLEESPEDVPDEVFGKLASPFEWFFAASVSQDDAAKLESGKSATLDFGRYCTVPIKARVVSISPPSAGECVVVFRCTESPSEMLSVRRVSAEIVFGSHDGIRIPKEAVLSDEQGSYVYTLTGLQAEKKYIQIVWETDEYFLAAVSEDAGGLRAGNDIILTTKGIYDGKVLK